MSNPYEVLGIAVDADAAEIKRAYIEGAQKYHPDKGGTEEKFIEIKRAYECLMDPAKRKMFDELGVSPDTPEFQLLNEAITSLCNLFAQMLAQLGPDSIKATDIVNDHRLLLKTATTQAKDEIRRAKEGEKRLKMVQKTIKKRMKKKSDKLPNIFQKVIEQKLIEVEGIIKNQEHVIEVITKALELLEDYEFDPEKIEQLMPQNQSYLGGLGGFTITQF